MSSDIDRKTTKPDEYSQFRNRNTISTTMVIKCGTLPCYTSQISEITYVAYSNCYIQGVTLPVVNTLEGDSTGEYKIKIKCDEIAVNASFINYRLLKIGVWNA